MAYTLNIPLTTNTLDADLLAMKNNFNHLNPAAAIITNIAPAADFTVTQNAVVPIASVNAGAVANTLYLKLGNVGIGTAAPQSKLDIIGTGSNTAGVGLLRIGDGADYQQTVFRTDNSGNSNFSIDQKVSGVATSRMFFERTSGNVGIGIIPTARDNTHLQIVDGIGFPATQVASTDPNTLDDYEEGTWSFTPTGFTVNSGSFTAICRYTKVGRKVTLTFEQSGGDVTWSAGSAFITGIPFVSNVSNGKIGAGGAGGNTVNSLTLALYASGATGQIYLQDSAANVTGLGFTLTYFV